jgi:deazaflavin-dependent oxidoreductase (nitroreductase family)
MSSRAERNQAVIDEFRAHEGQVGGAFADTQLLLLHTRGAKSGESRINPLAYFTDGDSVVVTAPNGGRAQHPAWYYNVLADPNVTVEISSERFHARADIVQEPERTRLYSKMIERYPGFADFERATSRKIPVVILARIAEGAT